MSKMYKQKKTLNLKNLKKSKTINQRKTIKQRGGARQNINPIKTIDNLDRTLQILDDTYELDKTLELNNKNNNNEKKRKTNILTQKYYKNKLNYMIDLFRLYWTSYAKFKKTSGFDYDNIVNNFTKSITTSDSQYNLVLNIDDIINSILFKNKEDYNYNTIKKDDYTINESYFDFIFNDQPRYKKYRNSKDKIQDKTYITDILHLFMMHLFDEHILFNYDILMFNKMFKDNLMYNIKFYATEQDMKSYTVYNQLVNEYLNFIYLYSNLKKKICNHIYDMLLVIDRNSSLSAIVKNDTKNKLINKHKNFLNTLLQMLEEKKLYFLNSNNNVINESKLNITTRIALQKKVLNRTSKYLPEKNSDEICITKIQKMFAFIKPDSGSGSGGKSMKEPLAI